MRNETVVRNYADTLFQIAASEGNLEEYRQGIELVVNLIEEDADFRKFLATPRIAVADKKASISSVFENRLPHQLIDFLKVTLDKRRQNLLKSIAEEFSRLVDDHEGLLHFEITIARDSDDGFTAKLKGRLSSVFDCKPIIHFKVRPEILGGMILRIGDTVFDGSLGSRLDRMRRMLGAKQVNTFL
jgi:F-type H+-transporting ATPase subunit delta